MAFTGLRDVLRSERELIESQGMVAYTATDIGRFGIAEVCGRVFGHMAEAVSGFVLWFDVDACDPTEAPGVEYPERGGLNFREARGIAEYPADAARLLCFEVLEVNPELDQNARSSRLAVSFIRSVVTGRPVYLSGRSSQRMQPASQTVTPAATTPVAPALTLAADTQFVVQTEPMLGPPQWRSACQSEFRFGR